MAIEQSHGDAVVNKMQLAKNAAANYLSFFVAAAIGLVATPILVRHLGVSTFGVLGVLEAVVSYLGLLEAGVATATVQRVAALRAVDNTSLLRVTLTTARMINAVSAIVLSIATVVLAVIVRAFVHVGGSSVTPVQVALVLFGLSAAIGTSSLTASATMLGGGRADRSALLSVVLGSISRVLQVVVVLRGGGLVGLAITSAIITTVGTLANIMLSRRTFPELRSSGWSFDPPEARNLLRVGLQNATLAVAGAMSYGIDTIVLSAIRTAAQVTPYVLAARLVRLVRNVATTGTNTLMPRIAHQHAQGDLEAGYRSYSFGLLFVLAIALPLEIVLLVFGRPLLHLWLGVVPPRTYEVLVAFLLLTCAQLVGGQSAGVLVAMERQKVISVLALPVALLNVLLSVLATLRYGPIGPVLGSLPQAIAIEAMAFPAMASRALAVPVTRLLHDVIAPLALSSSLCVALAYLLRFELVSKSIGAVSLDVVLTLIFGYVVTVGISTFAWPTLARDVWRIVRRQ